MHRNEILFNWTNLHDQLTSSDLAEWWDDLSGPEAALATELIQSGQAGEKWLAAKDLCARKAVAEAARMRLPVSKETLLSFHDGALAGIAVGYEAGQELIKHWGFKPEAREPNSMWDIMDFRVDGEAVIGLIGDDRGWDKDWVYLVIVAWYPKEVHDKWPPETALI